MIQYQFEFITLWSLSHLWPLVHHTMSVYLIWQDLAIILARPHQLCSLIEIFGKAANQSRVEAQRKGPRGRSWSWKQVFKRTLKRGWEQRGGGVSDDLLSSWKMNDKKNCYNGVQNKTSISTLLNWQSAWRRIQTNTILEENTPANCSETAIGELGSLKKKLPSVLRLII